MKNEIQIEKNNGNKVEKISKTYFSIFMEKAGNLAGQKKVPSKRKSIRKKLK